MKRTWFVLLLALALVLSCGSGALAAYDAGSVSAEAIIAANSRDALLTNHESVYLEMENEFFGTTADYATKEYQYFQEEHEWLYDEAGEWETESDDSGRVIYYNWEAVADSTAGEQYLAIPPALNTNLLLKYSIAEARDNGDGTLTVTVVQEPGSFTLVLGEHAADVPDMPADAAYCADITVDAETLEAQRFEDYGLNADGERVVISRGVVTYDAPEPEGPAAIRAASAAFRAGAPEAPRTITMIYDYGTPDEESCSVVVDQSFRVHPLAYYGYDLWYTGPDRLTVSAGGDGLSDVTIYAYCSGSGLYRHDPRLNPRVLADAVADEDAVYGFRPSETGSLAQYADADWSDPKVVAAGRADRIAYHESMAVMYDMVDEMRAAGEDIEAIARAVSAKRNELRLAACTSEEELATTKARNLEKYGHEEGPLPDEMYEKYGDWETVLVKAFSLNAAMDACLGLYDDYYDMYIAAGWVNDASQTPCERQYAVAAFMDAFDPWPEDGAAQLDGFADAGEIDASFLPEWELAVGAGLIKGYEDGTLRPAQTIRRIEAFVLLSRCLPELEATGEAVAFADVPDWAKADIDRLSAAGLLLGYGDGTLGAEDPLTVEQVYTILQRAAA